MWLGDRRGSCVSAVLVLRNSREERGEWKLELRRRCSATCPSWRIWRVHARFETRDRKGGGGGLMASPQRGRTREMAPEDGIYSGLR